MHPDARERAQVLGVAEGEDPAVLSHQRVALSLPVGAMADDGVAGRPRDPGETRKEGTSGEDEDPAVGPTRS